MIKMVEILQTIYEFHNKTTGTTSGLYHVKLDSGNKYYLLRNNESVGAIQHYVGRPASECVDIIRNDMREGFFEALAKIVNEQAKQGNFLIPTMNKILKMKTCKNCNYKKHCGGFRDKNNRCPECMVGMTDRWAKEAQ